MLYASSVTDTQAHVNVRLAKLFAMLDLHGDQFAIPSFLQSKKEQSPSVISCSHMGPKACTELCFFSPQIALHCETTDMHFLCRMACLFTPQLSMILTASYHRGSAPGWLVTIPDGWSFCPQTVTHLSANRARRRATRDQRTATEPSRQIMNSSVLACQMIEVLLKFIR